MAPEPTVAAILTPIAQGGIAVVNVAGPQAHDVIRSVFRPKGRLPQRLAGDRLHYGHIVDGGEVVDEVLVRFAQPERVEVNCHGGVVAVQRVLARLIAAGASEAEPEALAAPADPVEAAAARALLRAATPLGVEVLLDQLNGALGRALESLPWDDAGALASQLRHLLGTSRLGIRLWQPATAVIAGPANAGKSTLLNALAREDRVIVSPTPGTTRDTVTVEIALHGVPLWLTDTAGEREPESAIEAEAIGRARSASGTADLLLLVLDGSQPSDGPPPSAGDRSVLVLTKSDLGHQPWADQFSEALRVSAQTGDGMDALTQRIVEELVGEARRIPGAPVLFTHEQTEAVRSAMQCAEAGDPDGARAALAPILSGR
jgi:tRNA modification GTPase